MLFEKSQPEKHIMPVRLVYWLLLLVGVAQGAEQAPRAVAYAHALDRALVAATATLPTITAAAEEAAERMTRGGHVYVGGPMAGFDLEALYRAGGLDVAEQLSKATGLTPDDVVLLGDLAGGEFPNQDLLSRAPAETFVVLFASRGSPLTTLADTVVPTGVAGHGEVVTLRDGTRVAPLDGVLNVANLWTFCGELIAACTRRGRMPVVFQSVMIEGARERNAGLRGKVFHPESNLAAIPPGRLGREYLAGLRGHLAHLCEPTQVIAIGRAAALAAAAARSGKRRFAWMVGHYLPSVPGTPGDPGGWTPLTLARDPKDFDQRVGPGDVVLYVGYTWMETAAFAAAGQVGAKTVAVVAGTGDGPPPDVTVADIWIDPGWVVGDAEVTIPGYDVRALPPSGVVQAAVYWMVVAETAARLAE